MRLISKLSSGPSAKEPIFQIKVKPTRVNIKYELPHSQVHPSFSRKVLAFLGKEDRTSPALGQRRLSISILLQRLITLLCTSHTGQCAPSLKWYKIHTVQPVPPAGGEGTVQGGQREHPPRGAGAQGKGLGAGERQEAAPASGSQELPSCASWAVPPEGPQGWRSSVPATLTPKQPLPCHQPQPLARGPCPGAGEGTPSTWEL